MIHLKTPDNSFALLRTCCVVSGGQCARRRLRGSNPPPRPVLTYCPISAYHHFRYRSEPCAAAIHSLAPESIHQQRRVAAIIARTISASHAGDSQETRFRSILLRAAFVFALFARR